MKPETLERVKRATVFVSTAASGSGRGDRNLGSGSGFFINSSGMLITNNHVVDPAHGQSAREKAEYHYRTGRLTWTVITNSGSDDEKTWECDVLYQNDPADQAILQAYDEERRKLQTPDYLRFLPESRLAMRMKLWALGFPGGDSQRTSRDRHPPASESTGFVTQLPRASSGRVRMIFTDVLARPGNSGGPMVNVDGFLVGTVTLMGADESRANTSMLVPAALSRQFVANAFELGLIPKGTDFTPFMEILTNDAGRINIPEFDRRANRDVLFFEDGDLIYGKVATDKIAWESALGTLDVPTDAIAYVMSNDEGSSLYLEGGNRISASKAGAKLQFTPENGAKAELSFDDVSVVGFRTGGRRPEPVIGRVTIFDSSDVHLILSDVEGTGKFQSRAGVINIALEDIERIDPSPDGDKQVLMLRDGRRISGRFGEDKYRAKIAATGMPIEFGLGEIEHVTIETVEPGLDNVAGLSLPGVLASADREIRRIAEILESGDVSKARTGLEDLLQSDRFRRLPTVTKDQLTLLDGVAALRSGDYKTAMKTLRRSSRAKDENIAAYAQACVAVLKRFGEQCDGKPLSDRPVFAQAGLVLATESIHQTRELLKSRGSLEGKNRGEYVKTVSAVKKHEESMKVAAVLGGPEADDELIRLWKLGIEACSVELRRIDRELAERGAGASGSRRSGSSRSRGRNLGSSSQQREVDKLREHRVKVEEARQAYQTKLQEYGFRIEDPDIQAQREDQGQQWPDDEP